MYYNQKIDSVQKQEQLCSQAVSIQSNLFGESMATAGKLELTIKINEFPDDVKTVENNWKQFEVDCDGKIITITVKPKVFKKLEDAQANYPMWVAAIAGKMGEATPNGFVLAEPAIQVFEKKPKEPKSASEAVATPN
ncbi:fertility inhibition FinO-like protein [Ancylothrix sp. D3o]|uniref:fertility inhibition FinO-like protein n=1 Tax=Ancylothrix sp. D3o TaxID=2953691 RepID=UPI0021BB6EDD|nr:fertility inhibition FinO-like protein [Ancylothrix sp. D3o]